MAIKLVSPSLLLQIAQSRCLKTDGNHLTTQQPMMEHLALLLESNSIAPETVVLKLAYSATTMSKLSTLLLDLLHYLKERHANTLPGKQVNRTVKFTPLTLYGNSSASTHGFGEESSS